MTAADPAGFAPAKVNLSLQLAGRRADGYHRLISLVVFADVGDHVSCTPRHGLSLAIDGPFGDDLDTQDNLITRAARSLAKHHGIDPDVALRLTKNLPVASGIGGGSSDAAAALRLLSRLWDVGIPDALALELGADVPVCLRAPDPHLMSGIGDVLSPAPPLPQCWIVLANPGVEVPTAQVFAAVKDRNPPPAPAIPAQGFNDFADFCEWLGTQRNDLQAPAATICPPVDYTLTCMSQAPFARMSGSGATCFALWPDEASAQEMAAMVRRNREYWAAAAPVLRPPPPPRA